MQDFFNYQAANITVCNSNGIIVYMNQPAKSTFSDCIGKSLYDCHPPYAAEKIRKILSDGIPNAYTIEKKGRKKMIFQTPWCNAEGDICGLIEYSFVIPNEMKHHIRD